MVASIAISAVSSLHLSELYCQNLACISLTTALDSDASMSIDPEDLLSDSLQLLYDYTPVTHSSAGSTFTYLRDRPDPQLKDVHPQPSQRETQTITLQTPETQAQNWSLHASSIWAASIFLADHLEDLHISRHIELLRSTGELPLRVLELGAGAGLPSILIAKTYGSSLTGNHPDAEVVVSDYPDNELIRTVEENVRRNGVSRWCSVVPYAWGNDPSALFRPSERTQAIDSESLLPSIGIETGFDVIIAADTLWDPTSHAGFLKSLQLTLKKSAEARAYLVAGLHTGRYTLRTFMKLVSEYNFVLLDVTEREVKGDAVRNWDVDRQETEDERERRRWVIWMTLKWNI